eukprot:scaffold1860_cov403-Prasinococcus_capsulatus_cf.AAC.5
MYCSTCHKPRNIALCAHQVFDLILVNRAVEEREHLRDQVLRGEAELWDVLVKVVVNARRGAADTESSDSGSRLWWL